MAIKESFKTKFTRFFKTSRTNKLIAFAVALAVLGVGYALLRSNAAGFLFFTEAEQGPVSGTAQVINDPSASGGKAIQFTAAPTIPPPPATSQACPPYPAFPDDSCTGTPVGIKLAIIDSFSTTSTGQVIDAKYIKGKLVINHDNVTVTNSFIEGGITYNDHRGLTLRDVDLGPSSCAPTGNGGTRLLLGSDFTLTRVHMHNNADDLVALGGGGKIVIQDSLFNRTCYYEGDHLDALQYYDPQAVADITLVHNTIDARPVNITKPGNEIEWGNAAIIWADHPGAGSRLTVRQNFLSGGNYTFYALDAGAGSGVILDISGNRFARNQYHYGPCTTGGSVAFNGTAGIKWTDNAFSDGVALPLSGC